MFTALNRYRKILVTGPQRAGTTIAARMISADTGMRYVDEDEFLRDRRDLLAPFLESDEPMVIQCPALCRYAHELVNDRDAVVLMRREPADIIASQRRIGWNAERLELSRYGLKEGVIARVKYAYWETHQRQRIVNAIELPYESLAGHRLWVDPLQRSNFAPRQTTI